MAKPAPTSISPAIAATRKLVDGSIHQVRLSRVRMSPTFVKYEGPAKLYIERAGDRVAIISTRGIDWAEADERDAFFTKPGSMNPDPNASSGTLSFMVEDYLLQVLD